uniref:Uncharacterized protein n=1 Tax=Megaselia scalaris TaxID=36166 RepID=T1GD03_MEGSC
MVAAVMEIKSPSTKRAELHIPPTRVIHFNATPPSSGGGEYKRKVYLGDLNKIRGVRAGRPSKQKFNELIFRP